MKPADMLYWLIPWEPSPTIAAAFAVAALLYVRGSLRIRPTLWRALCFWTGWISMYAALHTQFDYYAEHMFFMHRIQHSVLHHIGPFLIAVSRPGEVFFASLKGVWRKLFFLRPAVMMLNHPFIAPLLFCSLILFWLIPPIHFIAMLDWRLYRVMNWGMAINGLMFWSLALNGRSLSPHCRIGLMLAIIPPQIIIGLLIFAAPHELYPLYTLCGRAFGISPMADQQIGGFILWVPAAMMSVIGVVVVIGREWLQPQARLKAPSAVF